jgi:hypothetical protein
MDLLQNEGPLMVDLTFRWSSICVISRRRPSKLYCFSSFSFNDLVNCEVLDIKNQEPIGSQKCGESNIQANGFFGIVPPWFGYDCLVVGHCHTNHSNGKGGCLFMRSDVLWNLCPPLPLSL